MNNNNNSNFGDLLASQSTNNNNHNKLTTLNIGSLNCRGLRKTTNPATSAAFIRYLRTVSLDILALQETHADTDEIAHLFKTQFQVNTSYWSNYSGIICFSPFLSLSEPIWNTIQRTPTVKVSHVHEAFDPVFVTAVYAPADTARRLSYLQSSLLNPYSILYFLIEMIDSFFSRIIIILFPTFGYVRLSTSPRNTTRSTRKTLSVKHWYGRK